MIRSIDVMKFAASNGFILQLSIAKEALQSINREALEEREKARYEAIVWDGEGDPPIGDRERWIHEEDAIGKATKESFDNGHMVYFLMKEGKLHHYQPFRAYDRGHIKLHDNPDHEHHWEKASADHIDIEIEQAVDNEILHLSLEKALELHEARSIPVGVSPVMNLNK